MTKTLLLTASTDGQTIKIMQNLAQEMQLQDFDLIDIHQQDSINLKKYKNVIIGASIRYGHFSKALYAFIHEYTEELNAMNAHFFGVNLTARKPEKNTAETNIYVIKFLDKIAWSPKTATVFAGALLWSRYNFWQTKIIQLIMLITKGPTDTTKELEFTDWDKVRAHADMLKRLF